MKTRQGFVSNSSSTSFVVTIDENSNTNAKIEIDFDLRSFVVFAFIEEQTIFCS